MGVVDTTPSRRVTFFYNMAAYYANLKSHQNLKISAWSVVPGQRCCEQHQSHLPIDKSDTRPLGATLLSSNF